MNPLSQGRTQVDVTPSAMPAEAVPPRCVPREALALVPDATPLVNEWCELKETLLLQTDRMCRGERGGFDDARLDAATCATLEARVSALRDCACTCDRVRRAPGHGTGPLDERMGDPDRYSRCVHGMP